MMRAVQQKRKELAPLLLSQTRTFVAPLRIDFTEDVSLPKGPSATTSTLTEWKAKKAGTEELLSLLGTYKDLGDSKGEPYLKFHNPRSFEDLAAPIPNFRAANLKPGEVPKFFDSVLQRRADAAVDKKSEWWAKRKEEALASAGKITTPFAAIPLPEWTYGKPVPLESFKKVTDAYVKALEPKRKLLLPTLPASVKDSLSAFASSLGQAKSGPEVAELVVKALADKAAVVEGGKTVEDFTFISKAQAAKLIAKRRAEVHERYLKLWAKKLLVAPETAVVPLKEVDAQLASKFENISPKYAELLAAVSLGSKTLGERVAASPAFTSFLLKREKEAVKEDFPASEADKEGAALAARLEDPKVALETLLGPELAPLGAGGSKLSEQVAAITEHKYTSDRYFYKEGKKLAARYAEEEKELAEELKAVYGDSADVAHFQAHPRTPAAVLADRLKESEAVAAQLEAASKAPDSTAYEQYAAAKRLALLKDPSNIPFEEVLYPAVQEELLALELAELQELEDKIDDAEEEELWLLTLTQQFKHIQKHFGVDLPHGVIAHMDPLFFKKVDWESTYGLDDWDMVLDDVASEFAREQWGTETLAHHFLPLIRYRRAKAKKLSGSFEAEQSVPRVA